jgi:hypothetical protein
MKNAMLIYFLFSYVNNVKEYIETQKSRNKYKEEYLSRSEKYYMKKFQSFRMLFYFKYKFSSF